MPPRRPKQPARKAAPRKAAPKKAASKKTETPDFNPKTHLLGDDGKVYERKIVSGHATGAGITSLGPKTDDHLHLEQKMVQAIQKAHAEGVTDEEMRDRILAAREEHVRGR